MKYFCLDRDSCGYTKTLTAEEFASEDFSNPFKNCTECNYYMIVVADDFSLEKLENQILSLKATQKIYESD